MEWWELLINVLATINIFLGSITLYGCILLLEFEDSLYMSDFKYHFFWVLLIPIAGSFYYMWFQRYESKRSGVLRRHRSRATFW